MIDRQITTRTGEQIWLTGDMIDFLRTRLRGELLQPGDPDYETVRRVWNGLIDNRPALIARCRGTADVIDAVTFAREHDLLLSVRGGGHSVAGHAVCDGGLMIDLSLLKGIRVDPVQRKARAQAGVTWGDFDRETQAFGLATPGGFVSSTGIAGLTLGGGFGWLSRKHGLTCDNLLSADVVTADGRYLTASATENSDLFWALRGGGGNFGVVTSFEYQLHPIGPTVLAGSLFFPLAQAQEVLHFYRDFTAAAPDELSSGIGLRKAFPSPVLPREIHGKPVVIVDICYTGSIAAGREIIQPLQTFGSPIVDSIGPKPYAQFQTIYDAGVPHGHYRYWKSDYLTGLSDEVIDTVFAHASHISSPLTTVLIFQLSGAVARVAEGATAAAHRDAAYVLNIATSWDDLHNTDKHVQWTRDFWAALPQQAKRGVYVNFLSADEGEGRVRVAYGANYKRLVALKNSYDPTNLFHLNQNIK